MIREESGLFDGPSVDVINLGYAHRDYLLQVIDCNGNAHRKESKPARHLTNKIRLTTALMQARIPFQPIHTVIKVTLVAAYIGSW